MSFHVLEQDHAKVIPTVITLEMMQQKSDETIEAIASLKEQIGRAKANAAQTGDYSDTDWFHRANRALRYKQADHQLLLREMAKVRSENKQAAHKQNEKQSLTFERKFFMVAKKLLDEHTFQMLMTETQSINATSIEKQLELKASVAGLLGAVS